MNGIRAAGGWMSLYLGHFVPFLTFKLCDLPPPAPSCGRQPRAGPRPAVTAASVDEHNSPRLREALDSAAEALPRKKAGSSLRKRRFAQRQGSARGALRRGCGCGRPGGRRPAHGDFLPRPPGGAGRAREDRPAPARRLCARGPRLGGEPRPGHRAASPATAGSPSSF